MKEGLIPTGKILEAKDTPFDFIQEFSTIQDKDRLNGAIEAGGR